MSDQETLHWPWWRFVGEFLYRDLKAGLILGPIYLACIIGIAQLTDIKAQLHYQHVLNVGMILLIIGTQIVIYVETRRALSEWREKQLLLEQSRHTASLPSQSGSQHQP